LNPSRADSSADPISKVPNIKMANGVAEDVHPEYHKKKKKL
jgi:hypothetical protein